MAKEQLLFSIGFQKEHIHILNKKAFPTGLLSKLNKELEEKSMEILQDGKVFVEVSKPGEKWVLVDEENGKQLIVHCNKDQLDFFEGKKKVQLNFTVPMFVYRKFKKGADRHGLSLVQYLLYLLVLDDEELIRELKKKNIEAIDSL